MTDTLTASEERPSVLDYDAILLDIGNVIIYDFPVELAYSFFVSREIISMGLDLEVTANEILFASRSPEGFIEKLGSEELWNQLNSIAWNQVLENWALLSIPIPGAIEAIKYLSHKPLAIVANQPCETMKVLERFDIDRFVDVIILDSMIGVSKPDLAIYRHASERLGRPLESSIMIGDRLDNDIFPAKALGLATAWIRDFPLDKELPVPLVTEEWKRHYYRGKDNIVVQPLEFQKNGLDTGPDYILGRLADLLI